MVLIFSEDTDLSTSKVIEWLIFYKIPHYRINIEDSRRFNLKIQIGKDVEITLHTKDQIIDLSTVAAVWFRRGEFLNIQKEYFSEFTMPLSFKEALQTHLTNEMKSLHEFIYTFLKSRAINSPLNYRVNKLYMLCEASASGFLIPRTIVTNSKKELIAFMKENNGIITKNIQDIAILKEKHYYTAQRTINVDQDYLKTLPDTFQYSLFQKEIPKKY
jgi:hypothetical protein